MQQTYETRGKIAQVEDQTQAARAAFLAGEMTDLVEILASIRDFISTWLKADL